MAAVGTQLSRIDCASRFAGHPEENEERAIATETWARLGIAYGEALSPPSLLRRGAVTNEFVQMCC